MPRWTSPAAAFATAIVIWMSVTPLCLPAQQTPTGFWNTISDEDGKPMAVVEIRDMGGELIGTVRSLLVPASPEDSICGKCPGDRKGQPIVGMDILRHMRQTGDAEWGGGEILDPQSGKTYRATMKLVDGGAKLVVRGYVGISLFGRSQTWLRQP